MAKEVSAGKKRSECKLEEEMEELGEAVLVHPAAPPHPLLGQHLLAVHVTNKLLLPCLNCHSQLWIGCVLAPTLTEVFQ